MEKINNGLRRAYINYEYEKNNVKIKTQKNTLSVRKLPNKIFIIIKTTEQVSERENFFYKTKQDRRNNSKR